MFFAIAAGVAVILSGFYIGFSVFQLAVGFVGIVVGLWALLVLRRRPD